MPQAYPYASSAKTAAARTAIGAQAIGQSEVTLYKQILVAIATGSVVPPTTEPPPGVPTLAPVLTLVSADGYVVDLAWTASNNIDVGTGYRLEYSKDGGPFDTGAVLGNVLEYQFDTEGDGPGDYEFRIIPFNSFGDAEPAAWSNEVAETLPFDPLLAIPHIAYWYGFKETDPATSGLYLDAACTTPITGEWDLVAGIKYNGVVFATQATEASRPLAVRASDGTWYCLFDGIDDWLDPALTMGGQVIYSVIMRSVTATWNNFWGILDNLTMDGGSAPTRWGILQLSNTIWVPSNLPAGVRRNGTDLTANYDCAPIDDWMTLTVTTADMPDSVSKGIGQLLSVIFGNFELAGMFIHVVDPDPADVAAVDAEFITRIPT